MLIGKTPVTAVLIGFQPIQSWTPRELQTSYFSPPGEMRRGGAGAPRSAGACLRAAWVRVRVRVRVRASLGWSLPSSCLG